MDSKTDDLVFAEYADSAVGSGSRRGRRIVVKGKLCRLGSSKVRVGGSGSPLQVWLSFRKPRQFYKMQIAVPHSQILLFRENKIKFKIKTSKQNLDQN